MSQLRQRISARRLQKQPLEIRGRMVARRRLHVFPCVAVAASFGAIPRLAEGAPVRKQPDAAVAVRMRAFHDTIHARSRDAKSDIRERRAME